MPNPDGTLTTEEWIAAIEQAENTLITLRSTYLNDIEQSTLSLSAIKSEVSRIDDLLSKVANASDAVSSLEGFISNMKEVLLAQQLAEEQG